jgi:sugar/nucleoside kinase (ribokinase family)
MKTNDVIALGNALMDFVIEIDDEKFQQLNLNKGEMHLVDENKAKEVLKKIDSLQLQIQYAPGGSAANTLRSLSLLGASTILVGKIGQDKYGEMYQEEMNKVGVTPKFNHHAKQTGHAVTFITPDAQRTFSVCLGAAVELYKEDLNDEDITNSKILHVEGYQVEGNTRNTILHAMEIAKKSSTLVSIDLADPGVIRRNKEFLQELIEKYADIVFLNETEAEEFTSTSNQEEAVKQLGQQVKIAVVKLGEHGSLVVADNHFYKIPPFPANCIDTNGAGDTYASGFLYGYCQNWNIEKSGRLGSALAAKVVEKKGVTYIPSEVNAIKKFIE